MKIAVEVYEALPSSAFGRLMTETVSRGAPTLEANDDCSKLLLSAGIVKDQLKMRRKAIHIVFERHAVMDSEVKRLRTAGLIEFAHNMDKSHKICAEHARTILLLSKSDMPSDLCSDWEAHPPANGLSINVGEFESALVRLCLEQTQPKSPKLPSPAEFADILASWLSKLSRLAEET